MDWERIEAQFRAGVMSVREIARAHDNIVTEAAIRKRAKRDGWDRDLSAKVRAKAEALVRKESVRTEVRTANPTEREVIEIEAEVQSRIQIAHRRDIGRGRNLVMTLLDELEAVCGVENAALLAELGALMRRPDERGQDKLNDIYEKLMSLPGRAKTMKDLGESLRVLVTMEREAFGLNTEAKDKTDDLTDLLRDISSGVNSAFKPVQVDPERDEE